MIVLGLCITSTVLCGAGVALIMSQVGLALLAVSTYAHHVTRRWSQEQLHRLQERAAMEYKLNHHV